ncbi:MAG TPA: DUF305 domain-containing protein [Pyrinomonadaceae bacterium]|nr:DUF305 domain-containing protein [Pyrinomonadaceae bacterium]
MRIITVHSSVLHALSFVIRVASPRSSVLVAAALAFLISPSVLAQQAKPVRGKNGPVVVQPGSPGQPTRTLPTSTRATLPLPSPADVQFMQHMIMHHAQAVEMTSLIESHTQNKELRTLGERISRSQSDEMKFMKRWLAARGKPTSMAISHGSHGSQASQVHEMDGLDKTDGHMLMPGMLTAKQMQELRKAKDKQFDRLFLSGMIQHHNGALVMVEDLFNTPGAGEDAEVFSFVTDVDSGQRAEIRVMQKMLETKDVSTARITPARWADSQ